MLGERVADEAMDALLDEGVEPKDGVTAPPAAVLVSSGSGVYWRRLNRDSIRTCSPAALSNWKEVFNNGWELDELAIANVGEVAVAVPHDLFRLGVLGESLAVGSIAAAEAPRDIAALVDKKSIAEIWAARRVIEP